MLPIISNNLVTLVVTRLKYHSIDVFHLAQSVIPSFTKKHHSRKKSKMGKPQPLLSFIFGLFKQTLLGFL